MDWDWVEWFSDGKINEIITMIAHDYKVATLVIGGPIVWALAKWVKWTPWSSDNQAYEQLRKMLGLGSDEQDRRT